MRRNHWSSILIKIFASDNTPGGISVLSRTKIVLLIVAIFSDSGASIRGDGYEEDATQSKCFDVLPLLAV